MSPDRYDAIILTDAPVSESDEYKQGIVLGYDSSGNVMGMEILSAAHGNSGNYRICD